MPSRIPVASRTPVTDAHRGLRNYKHQQMSHQYSSRDRTPTLGYQDVADTGAMATMGMPIVGDIAGLAADIPALVNNPSWSGAVGTLLGVAPFVPGNSITRLYKSVKDAMEVSPQNSLKALEDGITAVLDTKSGDLYNTKEGIHNEAYLDLLKNRAKKEGKDPYALGIDAERRMMMDDTEAGMSYGVNMFSREAVEQLQKNIDNWSPNYGGKGAESITSKKWMDWRKKHAGKITDLGKTFSTIEGPNYEKSRDAYIKLADKIGEEAADEAMGFMRINDFIVDNLEESGKVSEIALKYMRQNLDMKELAKKR